MDSRLVIRVGLLVFVLASVGFLVVKEMGAVRSTTGGAASPAVKVEEAVSTMPQQVPTPADQEVPAPAEDLPQEDPPTTAVQRSPLDGEAAMSAAPGRSSGSRPITADAVSGESGVAAVAGTAAGAASPPQPRTVEVPAAADEQALRSSRETRVVHVTYFFTTARCYSCIKLESMTDAALVTAFAGPLAEGKMEWHLVNVDRPENRHFIAHYGLYTKSVVVSERENGRELRWKNLPDVWRLLNDADGFQEYIVSEVEAFLGGA